MAELLPLRFRMLHYISTVDKTSADEIMKALEPEYGTEKQFRKEVFVEHLLDMKANFVIDDNDVTLDDKGELVIYYSINGEGKRLLNKYLPKSWNWKNNVTAGSF
jgi:DNA-binding PadR family transcriptional regulator